MKKAKKGTAGADHIGGTGTRQHKELLSEKNCDEIIKSERNHICVTFVSQPLLSVRRVWLLGLNKLNDN